MFLIISPGRSGSSYTAGQLVKAGVWGGDMRKGDRWNELGYFENIELHSLLREWYGSDWLTGDFPEEKEGWNCFVTDIIRRQGYEGGPWMFKCGAFYWKTFESFKPVVIKVWRNPDKILKSFINCGFLNSRYNKEEIKTIIKRQHDEMKTIQGLDVQI